MATSKGTKTQSFGTSRREGHDASGFYSRFDSLQTSPSGFKPTEFAKDVNHVWGGDARNMDACIEADASGKELPDGSVALVVTSPPYFAGKDYELAMGSEGIPASYDEYKDMLKAVFQQCFQKLEPGGRIAVNVANLGRKPYRSLSAEIMGMLQELGFLLRGEIIWVKAEASSGSCAWGSFRSASNPVLRDVSERIIVASKDSFTRSMSTAERKKESRPCESTMTRDAFLAYTTDVWRFPPESATKVGHPAPFPKELPRRLINLYTFAGDLVLDPFMGSGTTAVAALETGRRYAGFDLYLEYVERARERLLETEQEKRTSKSVVPGMAINFEGQIDDQADSFNALSAFKNRAVEQGTGAQQMALNLLEICGFRIVQSPLKFRDLGLEVKVLAEAKNGRRFYFDVSGTFSGDSPGLKQNVSLWEAVGKACILGKVEGSKEIPFMLLTTDRPQRKSSSEKILESVWSEERGPIHGVFEMGNMKDCKLLWELGQGNDN